MSKKAPTLYQAIEGFLGPLVAEYGRIVEEGSPDMPVTISLGGYKHKTTLASLKALDEAHRAAFEAKNDRAARREYRSRKGAML